MLEVRFQNKAEEELKKIPVKQRHRIFAKIEELCQNSEPPGSRQLTGKLKLFRRIKVGDYRVVYFVEDNTLHITLVGGRGNVYQKAKRL